MLASIVSVAAFNFFFTRPYGTLQVYDSHAYVTFGVMLVTSLVVGSLTAQVSLHARLADRREEAARNLYVLTRGLSSVRDPATMAQAAHDAIARPYQVAVRLWLGDDAPREEADVMAVEWVREHGQAAGRDTGVMASRTALYLPLSAEGETVGVMTLTPDDEARRFSEAERLQFDTFATLIASALLRARQGEAAEKVRIESENEKLRNVLLASVSHDLRTPLTVMNGGLGQLLKMRRKLPREALDEVTALWGHLTRLQAFVDNLLRLAALTSGRMKLNLQPYLIQEIIGAAMARIATQKGERQIRTVMTGTLPMVRIDGALIEQVLVNLLDNAIRHTAGDGVIVLSAARDGGALRVSVADNGPGFSGAPDRLFEQFHSDRESGSGQGTGLGLAICRGVVQAHGGRVAARNQRDGGALFTFTLPSEAS
ncbi:MAG: ATP-binding protein [Asticcacaulis sp.]